MAVGIVLMNLTGLADHSTSIMLTFGLGRTEKLFFYERVATDPNSNENAYLPHQNVQHASLKDALLVES